MSIVEIIESYLWGSFLAYLLLFTALILSIKTRFIHIRRFGESLKHLFTKTDRSDRSLSPFQALFTSLSSTIGAGNIVSVPIAITIAGPGVVFWMWLTAILGGATKYFETFLSVKYREIDSYGNISGGPMYYIASGLKERYNKDFRALAKAYAILLVIGAFGIGNMVQSNAITTGISNNFQIKNGTVGIILAVLVSLTVIGGIKSIAKFSEKVTPLMSVSYLFFSLLIIVYNYENILDAFKMIFVNAFSTKQVIVGSTISIAAMGISRGVASNEAGLGSASIVHATSSLNDPHKQGLVASLGTVIDTLIICTITALVVLTSGFTGISDGIFSVTNGHELVSHNSRDVLTGLNLMDYIYSNYFGFLGGYILAIIVSIFSFTTIIGWYYYQTKAIQYLFGNKYFKIFNMVFIVFVFLGSVLKVESVWTVSSIGNGLMALPNVIAILLLSSFTKKIPKSI